MAVTALEAHQSRKIGPDFREYVYIVTGTDDEVAAQNAAAATRAQYITIGFIYTNLITIRFD